MKYLITLLFVSLSLCSDAQNDTLKLYREFGFGYSHAIFQESIEPLYGLDIFTLSRKHAANLNVSMGYRLSKKIDVSLNYGHNSLTINQKEFIGSHLSRHPEYFIYHDFGLDETNSTPSGFRHNYIMAGVNYRIKGAFFELFPRTHLGLGFWQHRKFSFVQRNSGSNAFQEYRVSPDFKPQFTLSSGLRMVFRAPRKSLNQLSSFFLDVSAVHSGLTLTYDIENTCRTNEVERISFKSRATILNISIGIRVYM